MLVITRKPCEKIRLSNGVMITIEGVQGNRVKIGIEAPDSVSISRSERCIICGRSTFEFYLGYRDMPICGRSECEQEVSLNKSLFQ